MSTLSFNNSKWKSINLSDLGNNEFEFENMGLVEFSELTNYGTEKVESVNLNRVRKRKRKNSKLSASRERPGTGTESTTISKETNTTENASVNLHNNSVIDEFAESSVYAKMHNWADLPVPYLVLCGLSRIAQKFVGGPTPIQRESIHASIHKKANIICGAAETGSGKTLAFGIPLLHRLLEKTTNDLQQSSVGALIIVPTRELAVQVAQQLRDASACCPSVVIETAVGGLSLERQRRRLLAAAGRRRNSEINPATVGDTPKSAVLVGTPGRLWELIESEEVSCLLSSQALADSLRCVVVDEADRLTERGHFEQLTSIMTHVHNGSITTTSVEQAQLKRRHWLQTFIFSATLSFVHSSSSRWAESGSKLGELIEKLARVSTTTGSTDTRQKKKKKHMKRQCCKSTLAAAGVKIIDLSSKRLTVETLKETFVCCPVERKDLYLYYLLLQESEKNSSPPHRTLVFCNSIDCVRRLVSLLTILYRIHVEANGSSVSSDKKSRAVGLLSFPLALHATMRQKQRLKNIERFTNATPPIIPSFQSKGVSGGPDGKTAASVVLVATDVAARGIDIADIDLVIHYELPPTAETYVHRSGRTARATKPGLSVLLVSASEKAKFASLLNSLHRDISSVSCYEPIDHNLVDQYGDILSSASDIEKLEHRLKKRCHDDKWLRTTGVASELGDDYFKETKITTKEESAIEIASVNLLRSVRAIHTGRQMLSTSLNTASPLRASGHTVRSTAYPTQDLVDPLSVLCTSKGSQRLSDPFPANSQVPSFREKSPLKRSSKQKQPHKRSKKIKQKQ